jgi:hypothetical protein
MPGVAPGVRSDVGDAETGRQHSENEELHGHLSGFTGTWAQDESPLLADPGAAAD